MTNLPFGFGAPSGDDDDAGGGSGQGDPFGGLLGGSPADLGAAFQQLGRLLSSSGSGPVNWDLARDVARQTAAASNDRYVGDADRRAVDAALSLAETWLDAATTLPVGATSRAAWSRADWIEATLPVWKEVVEPIAARVGEAMAGSLGAGMPGVPEEMAGQLAAMSGQLGGMMRQLGGAMFGAQVGQALGTLAGEVVGSTDVGLPLGPPRRAALLPASVAVFGEGLGVDADQVRLYLALREAAHHRLFAHVPWLGSRLLAAVGAFAAGIEVDPGRMQEAMGSIDPMNPESIQEALAGGLFAPQTTPAQEAALARLETLLALVEGWVDVVVDEAASPHLPAAGALHESVRRRRATGGPAEATFAALVGLELRPRRMREAASLWGAIGEARGMQGRDAVWAHPDLLPGEEDLEDPTSFVSGGASLDSGFDLSALEQAGEAPPEPPAPGQAPPPPDDASGGEPPTDPAR